MAEKTINYGGQGVDHEPTDESREQVYKWSCAGSTQSQIARNLGIAKNTLRKHYKPELDAAIEDRGEEAEGQLAKLIRQGNVSAVIFYLKTKQGWSTTVNNVMSGNPSAPPIKIESTVTVLTREEAMADAAARGLPTSVFSK